MIKGEIIIKKRLFCLKHNKKNYRKKTGKGKKRRKTQEESTTDTLDNFEQILFEVPTNLSSKKQEHNSKPFPN